MSYVEVPDRMRHEAIIEDALRGATVIDADVYVDGAGNIAVDTLEVCLKDGRVVTAGLPRIGSPRWGDCKDIVLVTGDDQRELTVQQDFLRDEEAEARAMAEVDALLAADERDGETGYDGVRLRWSPAGPFRSGVSRGGCLMTGKCRPNAGLCRTLGCPDLVPQRDLADRIRQVCRAAGNRIPGNLEACPTGYLDRKFPSILSDFHCSDRCSSGGVSSGGGGS